jgi:hypothetical protein
MRCFETLEDAVSALVAITAGERLRLVKAAGFDQKR